MELGTSGYREQSSCIRCGINGAVTYDRLRDQLIFYASGAKSEHYKKVSKNMNELHTIIFSALVSVIVAYATAKASGYSKDVVEERKEWRDRIRQLTLEAVKMMLSKETQSPSFLLIIGEFRIRLNPNDKNDNDILETLHRAVEAPDDLLRRKFLAQAARLLKHDWERAKAESRLLGFFDKPNGPDTRRLRSSDYMAS
ncbi:MAG: hypothetical protein ABJP44_19445 [Sulfitobacter sp.]|uniref:hypothetical protein n=1 Tax=Sulfitobacter sp. TaxID=1903071 RepID=UPI003298CB2F